MANAAFISVYCADRLAEFEAAAVLTKLSRSELFRTALDEWITRHHLRPKIARYLQQEAKVAEVKMATAVAETLARSKTRRKNKGNKRAKT